MWRSEDSLREWMSSLLQPCESWGLDSSGQTGQQALLASHLQSTFCSIRSLRYIFSSTQKHFQKHRKGFHGSLCKGQSWYRTPLFQYRLKSSLEVPWRLVTEQEFHAEFSLIVLRTELRPPDCQAWATFLQLRDQLLNELLEMLNISHSCVTTSDTAVCWFSGTEDEMSSSARGSELLGRNSLYKRRNRLFLLKKQ